MCITAILIDESIYLNLAQQNSKHNTEKNICVMPSGQKCISLCTQTLSPMCAPFYVICGVSISAPDLHAVRGQRKCPKVVCALFGLVCRGLNSRMYLSPRAIYVCGARKFCYIKGKHFRFSCMFSLCVCVYSGGILSHSIAHHRQPTRYVCSE